MKDPFVLVWAVLLFTSLGWYGFLVFYIGAKAGKELKTLIADLTLARPPEPPAPPAPR
ncbi:MAG: hypothetical protein NT173_12890 [Opitutales bacterium]|nr:hypothetical protein [Opitutales bacterium]